MSPAFAIGFGTKMSGEFAVEATDPDISFVLDVAEAVAVRDAAASGAAPCLAGDAVTLTEALSLRTALPASAPPRWAGLLEGLASVFSP